MYIAKPPAPKKIPTMLSLQYTAYLLISIIIKFSDLPLMKTTQHKNSRRTTQISEFRMQHKMKLHYNKFMLKLCK